MVENLKSTNSHTVLDKINENIAILTHLTYLLSLIADSIVSFVIAIVLFFVSKDALSKSHFKFIIITNVILLIVIALLSLITGFSILSIFYGLTDTVSDINATPDGSYLKPLVFAFIGIILAGIWFFIRIIGGWVALFRKEPIQGHFGIRWRKK